MGKDGDFKIEIPFGDIKDKVKDLDKWSREFWKIKKREDISPVLASRGYEDKGHGHILGIIKNVEDLLEKYTNIFNYKNKKKVSNSQNLIDSLEPNILLFYLTAYLHDIGMKFAEVFEVLKPIVEGSERHSLHIMELIHNFHQYGSFIVLLGISQREKEQIDAQEFPFFVKLPVIQRDNLNELFGVLKNIHEQHFDQFFKECEEFIIMLAILCLLHKEVKAEYIDNILKKIEDRESLLNYFQKWWGYFKLTELWTNKISAKTQSNHHSSEIFSGSGQILVKNQDEKKLNFFLVEALLQYGDKTEITINRLTRNPHDLKNSPLIEFINMTRYDNDRDSIISSIGKKAISDFARFRACRFIPVLEIKAVGGNLDNSSIPTINPKLDVVIMYQRYKGDNDIFPILRYHNEKDFYDLGFLQAIQVHFPLILKDMIDWQNPNNPFIEITFKKTEQDAGAVNDDRENDIPEDYNPFSSSNRKAITKFSQSILNPELKKKKEGPKKVFYETSDLIVPSSFEVMAVFNLFLPEDSYMINFTTEDIAYHTGISEKKSSEICNIMQNEGYLVVEQEVGKYRLTGDVNLRRQIAQMRDQYKDEHTFQQMCNKIEDILKFGKPLALSDAGIGETVKDIGIPGLNIIFGGLYSTNAKTKDNSFTHRVPGLPRSHTLLIKGEPGTGKTTIGMQIALYLKQYRAKFLTFEEDINQLCNDLSVYCKDDSQSSDIGWNKEDIRKITYPLTKIRTPSAWQNPDVVLEELISVLDNELPQLLVIDSISRFRDLGGDTNARQILRRLIRNLKCRRITAIFLGEDRENGNTFEEYEVDGVIHLKWFGDMLTFSINKLRGQKAYKGPHSAALLTIEDLQKDQHKLIAESIASRTEEEANKNSSTNRKIYLTVGFNVFPEISVYKDLESSLNIVQDENHQNEPISTGTPGLDNLLKISPEGKRKGFKQGETILLVGSAGAGKTLLALNFMRHGYLTDNSQTENKHLLWINFEGDRRTLKFAVGGYTNSLSSDYEEMLNSKVKTDTKKQFAFIDFPSINLDLNKIVFTLEAFRLRYGIDRLVIDSITELEKAKGSGQPGVKTFLSGLIEFLRARGITTIFVCRSDAFFKSIDKIEEQVSSLVDLIICIRNFDIHNQIHKGIYIQKARGRAHNSKIMRMNISSREGINVEDSGWDLENLLAGDTSSIEQPQIFFKLFYENPAEREINHEIIDDFNNSRYPGENTTFTLVKKPSIYTEFWSFKGQYSAGHANTRVLSIPDYVMTAFRDNDRLATLNKYLKSELLQKILSEKHLRKFYSSTTQTRSAIETPLIDSIPCYCDFGVFAFKNFSNNINIWMLTNDQKESLAKLDKILGEMQFANTTWQKNKLEKYSWDYLIQIFESLKGIKDKNMQDIFPFAFPPFDNKSEFVAFFMELLWSHGGDIYEIKIGQDYDRDKYLQRFKEAIRKSILQDVKNNFKSIFSDGPYNKEEKDNFENRFSQYGLELRGIKREGFIEWIKLELAKETGDCFKSVLKLDGEPFKKTLEIIFKLIHGIGVPNPIHGEFRDRSILSRCWYSCNSNVHENPTKVLPLPLAEIEIDLKDILKSEESTQKIKYYRSITCLTYWALAMLKNALSPEIGGNFIESMNAPNYYAKRLSLKKGMPVTNWELTKKRFSDFDPNSYELLEKIMANGQENEDLLEAISNYLKNPEAELEHFSQYATQNKSFIRRELIELLENLPQNKEQFITNLMENDDSLNKNVFFPKMRQSRFAFYQIEQALHFQFLQLLIPKHEFRNECIYSTDIFEETKSLFSDESYKEGNGWKNCFEKISREFRMHIAFELLSYFYIEGKS